MKADVSSGPKVPGRPQHIMVTTAESGIFILDEAFLLFAYWLWYFSTVSMYRSLVNQYRFVKRLVEENIVWFPLEIGNVEVDTAAIDDTSNHLQH